MSYDLAILGDPREHVSDLTFDNTANGGIYKLVQRTLILMFTDIDDPNNLGFGTDLASETLSNNSDTEHIKNIFNLALASVGEYLGDTTALDAPDDEKLDRFEVKVERDDRQKISVSIGVFSQAGTNFSVDLPVDKLNPEQTDG